MAAVEERVGEAGVELRQGGAAIHHHNACVATNVAEGLVVWAGYDVPSIAAHQPQLCTWHRWQWLVPRFGLPRAWRGVGGFWVL